MSPEQESIWLATLSDADRRELEPTATSQLLTSPDLLVLGSGLTGLAVAYFAAERGARVQILAETRLGLDAEASLGCIIPNACGWQFSTVTQPLAQASRDWWAKLAVRPEFQLDWRVCGALMVDEQRLQPNPREHMLAILDAGYSVHDVDAEQIALLEPQLAACELGGLHYPSEAVLHPLRASCGFVRGLRKRGGQISFGDISKLQIDANRVSAVETAAGRIEPKFVLAADHEQLCRLLPSEASFGISFEATQRVFIASRPQPPLLKRPVLDASWMVQLKSGEIAIELPGAQSEAASEKNLLQLRQRLPALSAMDFPFTWTATSERAPDACPVIDRLPKVENAWYCGGLDFGAVLFAPIIGKLLADGMLQGQPVEDLAPFAVGSR